ncbi:alpha/beta hydrolase [Ferrovibrio sp.]|uniref:alpha/beta hydrolase n=1 Tax=Ferrovibrio sp. TaxID=1917215 RepID=UPI0035B38C9D
MIKTLILGAGITFLLASLCLAALIAFGTAVSPPVLPTMAQMDRRIGETLRIPPPPVSRIAARDGTSLAYRLYPGRPGGGIAVLVHGSSGSGVAMHALGLALRAAGISAYAVDIRGHGESGRLGDIGYVGQLEDDLSDLLAATLPDRPAEPRILIGHSSGGGFVLRIAAGRQSCLFDGYLALAPFLGARAPTSRPNAGGWAAPYIPRIIGLGILRGFGVTAFDHLPVIAFGVPEDARGIRTRTYSMRLLLNFAFDDDWQAALRRIARPTRILVGTNDELFNADAYDPLLKSINPKIAVTMQPDADHMGVTLAPAALEAIAAASADLLKVPPAGHCAPSR